jgi:ribosomal protein S18 acetylase RimI-like enzyme
LTHDIAIRRLRPGDIDAVVDIYLSLATHHAALGPDRYRVPERADVAARFDRVAGDTNPANLHLVAIVDGQVVGQLDAWGEEAPGPGSTRRPIAGSVVGLAVLPAHRGRGIGTALIAAVEAWARDTGQREIRLEVAVENAAARRLYERLGYEPATTVLTKRV